MSLGATIPTLLYWIQTPKFGENNTRMCDLYEVLLMSHNNSM